MYYLKILDLWLWSHNIPLHCPGKSLTLFLHSAPAEQKQHPQGIAAMKESPWVLLWRPGAPFKVWAFSGIVHPQQRCGYSDSLFARKDTFPYCRVQKWVWALWVHPYKRKLYPRKKTVFLMEKRFVNTSTGWKTRAGSAGSDNSASWSCKTRVTAKVVQNETIWIENQENQGLHFSDVRGNPGFGQRSLRGNNFNPSLPPFYPAPPNFLQYLAALAAKYSKKYGF